jgi:hypothetical protein
MSIFGNVADSHLAKVNAAKEAAEVRAKQEQDAHEKFEQAFSVAVKDGVVPYYERLQAEISEKGFASLVDSGRDGYGRLFADLKFVPIVGQSLASVPLDVCVFRVNANTGGLISWSSYFNQRLSTGIEQGQLSLAQLSEDGLQNYLQEFFTKSFAALAPR